MGTSFPQLCYDIVDQGCRVARGFPFFSFFPSFSLPNLYKSLVIRTCRWIKIMVDNNSVKISKFFHNLFVVIFADQFSAPIPPPTYPPLWGRGGSGETHFSGGGLKLGVKNFWHFAPKMGQKKGQNSGRGLTGTFTKRSSTVHIGAWCPQGLGRKRTTWNFTVCRHRSPGVRCVMNPNGLSESNPLVCLANAGPIRCQATSSQTPETGLHSRLNVSARHRHLSFATGGS